MSDLLNCPIYTLDTECYPHAFTQIVIGLNAVPHSHEFYEFVYVQEGKAINVIGDEQFELTKGDFSLVMPGERHKIISEKNCRRRDICVSVAFFDEICKLVNPLGNRHSFFSSQKVKKFTPSPSILPSIEEKLDYYSLKNNHEDVESRVLLFSVLSDILFQLVPRESASSFKNKPAWLNTIMIRFQNIEYLQKGLNAITADVNYNQIYINRVFKQYTGMSLTAYLSDTKLKLAASYLRTSDHSINEISEMLGFSSPSFFYKQFKTKYGVTPSEYRATCLSDNQIILF